MEFSYPNDYNGQNKLWGRLIDGRAIHFFLQFFEPNLLIMHLNKLHQVKSKNLLDPELLDLLQQSSPLSRSLACLLYSNKLSCDDAAAFVLSIKSYTKPVLQATPNTSSLLGVMTTSTNEDIQQLSKSNICLPPEPFVQSINEALKVVYESGLGFFIELAVGIFVNSDHGFPQQMSDIISVNAASKTMELAEKILWEAGQSWFKLWCSVEELVIEEEPNTDKVNPYHLQDLASIFSGSIVCECYRRLIEVETYRNLTENYWQKYQDLYKRKEILINHLTCIPGFALCKELVCCWFPCWERFQFILGSPFDHRPHLPIKLEAAKEITYVTK